MCIRYMTDMTVFYAWGFENWMQYYLICIKDLGISYVSAPCYFFIRSYYLFIFTCSALKREGKQFFVIDNRVRVDWIQQAIINSASVWLSFSLFFFFGLIINFFILINNFVIGYLNIVWTFLCNLLFLWDKRLPIPKQGTKCTKVKTTFLLKFPGKLNYRFLSNYSVLTR